MKFTEEKIDKITENINDFVSGIIAAIVLILILFILPDLYQYNRWQDAYIHEVTDEYYDSFGDFIMNWDGDKDWTN